MKIVIDTSTLISLAKIDAIELLKNINGEKKRISESNMIRYLEK